MNADTPARRGFAAQVADVEKRYGATRALKGVSLSIRTGSVHSLVGENGAGKSTLLGALAGRVAPDSGTVQVFGSTARLGNPRFFRRVGVAAIYQELTIIPAMTAAANVFLGHPAARFGWQRTRNMNAAFDELARSMGVQIKHDARAGDLSVANQQMLEIMRAVQSGARMMLFDEPTASLSAPERERLHQLFKRLTTDGVTVVLVSHNMQEVLDLSDEVTVFRNGEVVASRPTSAWTKSQLIESMVGEGSAALLDAMEQRRETSPQTETSPPIALEARGLCGHGPTTGIDLSIRSGEIVGIAGLVGSGRSSLLRMLAGLAPRSRGTVKVRDTRTDRIPRSVVEARQRGIALVPEDRKLLGLVPALSATENIALSDFSASSRLGWVSGRRMRRRASESATSFAFDPSRLTTPVGRLSGGNQQKALLARWMYSRPLVLLADEPTRGIDIGAKDQIMRSLTEYARSGTAVIMVSSEIEELLAYCDRILVLESGDVVANFYPRREIVTEDDILHAAFGVLEENHVHN